MGEPVKRYLYICNQTAITAEFNVRMELFTATQLPTPPADSRKESHRFVERKRSVKCHGLEHFTQM